MELDLTKVPFKWQTIIDSLLSQNWFLQLLLLTIQNWLVKYLRGLTPLSSPLIRSETVYVTLNLKNPYFPYNHIQSGVTCKASEATLRGLMKPKQRGLMKPRSVAVKPSSAASEGAQCGFWGHTARLRSHTARPHEASLFRPHEAALRGLRSLVCYPRLSRSFVKVVKS